MNSSVLIVDDSLTVRMDLSDAFEAAGLHTVPCSTLAQAHQALAEESVGLVVLDLHLPDGSGVDFLKEVRSADVSPPVIMLTADKDVQERVRAMNTSADAYIGKPYDTPQLVARARELLSLDQAPAEPTAKQPHATVLVIDDSATFRDSLTTALEGVGYTVIAAASGKEAFERMARTRPNAIVVDGVMPGMDGATFIRHVRLDAAFRSIPCLLLTASEDGTAQLDALEAGADAFVRKDHDFDVILARLAAVLRQQGALPTGVTATVGPRRVLAVDDSRTYLHELAEALGDEGYDVVTATSGEEAIDMLADQSVDCILMDVMMPGMGGKEACRRIKSAPTVRETPLILLTALEDRDAMLEGLSAGADDYIPKSSEFEVLRARVRAQIRRKQFEDENRNIREQLMRREVEAAEARSAREVAEARAQLVEELERKVEERTRALEAEVVERRHAERMASVGMLSASIAHEINNPLAVVTGNLDIISMVVDDVVQSAGERPTPEGEAGDWLSSCAERLQTIRGPLADSLEAVERVREIVRDLRIFSRSDEGTDPIPVDIHRVLESSIRMASNEVRHRADLLREFGEVPMVAGSETRLGQVFLNLIVNAAQAIPEGQVGDNLITVATVHDAHGRVTVEVRDTGVGIPEDKLTKVFDPFFTTKPAGIGTGLGLAICHRIIDELGGEITVESTVGEGTTFRVTLRAADAPETAATEAQLKKAAAAMQPKSAAARRRHRILVVDDEASLAKTIENILSPEHDVVALTSAREALERIKAGERFDAILSDVMMPDMGGRDLYARLQEISPSLAQKMIFMTGGAFSSESQSFLHQSGRPVVEKPFKAAALRDRIREILG